ncbi:hypothetical protein CGCSCA2_v004811 [Colletotrichum siamense]|uniref:Zn(2)-C6 fungal-type domain-containing protein n=1 Tax=Colletotrichum siamense TaxID=690259 RepID=A0A9P5EWJ6_COLSI|nr:uncharacterized protein CGCS363_v007591 [Colletotrichum siamense]KAF4861102.1 hypothetical protein CGCSCA2_v004811 [Colletotrichum siamense]KAF5500592.1 hypothetical protein CGCS363_v007591 [Colletotrichum siamense]
MKMSNILGRLLPYPASTPPSLVVYSRRSAIYNRHQTPHRSYERPQVLTLTTPDSIGERGRPPCAKCVREGVDCSLAGSRRGGDYSQYRGNKRQRRDSDVATAPSVVSVASFVPETIVETPKPREQPLHRSLQNPSDALLILARAAEDGDDDEPGDAGLNKSTPGNASSILDSILSPGQQARTDQLSSLASPGNQLTAHQAVEEYPPVKEGALDLVTLQNLIRHYADNYHPFFPIVPANVLMPQFLPDTIKHESFLLTAALVVASRDQSDLTELHQSIWQHMRRLILDVVLVTYLSDRQISIRMGQAFWSRGPALSARFTADDFPSLQPQYTSGEDFASLLQAQVELTTLFGNAHDILFASKQRTGELMTRGDYTKYIDDASRAIVAWDLVWNGLTCSQHLKSCLKMMEKYLRLYVNAFAFQAVLYRASTSGTQEVSKSACFPHSAMASPDARHVYEAVDAAEALLRIAIEDIDAEKYLRYMPARFYLYEIHSSVFLYKAHASGAVSSGKHAQTANLMRRFIGVLEIAATDADHIAAKYAKLLNGLWFHRSDSSADATRKRNSGSNVHSDEFQEVNAVQTYSNEVDDADSNHLPSFDEIGLQPLDWIESVEGLFSMPAAFPWDQPIF